ncbi:hypothetical protein SAMN02745121_06322 [Nannocystis exedens]|uniref:Iron-containing redox enzyme n=1 Tax=Nannocystis exedens TaxID=54 RepID=A0A1I2EYE1_9BACT|nr:hypothetical protein [Nannocystis exedens]PCC69515.1 hypothetical protein NAEX_02537 [Nannocystis exedens]SFE97647.1 hypothetical protein SAMN02745121_06322 [Nannocystis exedens]
MSNPSMSGSLELYEECVQPARARFARGEWVTRVIGGELSPDQLELFLLCFCALGVQMTAPVEGWIRRAGERCLAAGLHDLGTALVAHARHEAGHDAMMVDDTRSLAARRSQAGRPVPAVETLLAHPPTPGVRRYVQVHEDVIAGPAPYAQIAIEYEIERLSVTYGPGFIARCVADLGDEVKRCLSFVQDHVELDVGHTKFNARKLDQFLRQRPGALDDLVATGSEALAAYDQFLADALALALGMSTVEAPTRRLASC